MYELQRYEETAAAVWVVHGAWWVVLRDEDATPVAGEGHLLLGPEPGLN